MFFLFVHLEHIGWMATQNIGIKFFMSAYFIIGIIILVTIIGALLWIMFIVMPDDDLAPMFALLSFIILSILGLISVALYIIEKIYL
jgi:ABC-type transport system involved in multi-copper enzyme maturation permease subunit